MEAFQNVTRVSMMAFHGVVSQNIHISRGNSKGFTLLNHWIENSKKIFWKCNKDLAMKNATNGCHLRWYLKLAGDSASGDNASYTKMREDIESAWFRWINTDCWSVEKIHSFPKETLFCPFSWCPWVTDPHNYRVLINLFSKRKAASKKFLLGKSVYLVIWITYTSRPSGLHLAVI